MGREARGRQGGVIWPGKEVGRQGVDEGKGGRGGSQGRERGQAGWQIGRLEW